MPLYLLTLSFQLFREDVRDFFRAFRILERSLPEFILSLSKGSR